MDVGRCRLQRGMVTKQAEVKQKPKNQVNKVYSHIASHENQQKGRRLPKQETNKPKKKKTTNN